MFALRQDFQFKNVMLKMWCYENVMQKSELAGL